MAGIGAAFSLAVFAAALFALYRALHDYQLADILHGLTRIAPVAVMFSMLATAGSYLALAGFDWLAIRYIRRNLSVGRILMASFVSHAVSHSTGFGALTGGAIRYRIYSAAGLSVIEVATVVLFCGVTFALGASSLAAITLAMEPGPFADLLQLPAGWVRATAALVVLTIIAYVVLGHLRRRPWRLFNRPLMMPRPKTALAQVAVAALDLCCAAAALFLLLPDQAQVSYPAFVGVYVLAILAGLLAHVPGGLGVFETTVMILVPGAPADAMFGALLVFRVVYFLLPLILGAVLLGTHEGLVRIHALRRASDAARLWIRELQPPLFAALTFASGAVLFFVSIAPRVDTPPFALPDWVMDATGQLIGSLGGVLLLMARAVHRRLAVAHMVVVSVLICANLAVIIRDGDYLLAGALALVAALLTLARDAFYRQVALAAVRLSAAWGAAIVSVLLGGGWLAVFAAKRPGQELGDAVTSGLQQEGAGLRAVAGPALLVALAWLALWARRRAVEGFDEPADALARVVAASSSALANLAYHPDVEHLLAEDEKTFLLYSRHEGQWVAIGEPSGPPGSAVELSWKFREMAEETGAQPIFWNVANRPLYLDLGLSFVHIGDAATVDLSAFDLDAAGFGRLRRTHAQGKGGGLSSEISRPADAARMAGELAAVSEAWWANSGASRRGREIDETLLRRYPAAILRRHEAIIGFALLWASGDGKDLAVDLLRCASGSDPAAEEFLLAEVMGWGRRRGYLTFDLGLFPGPGLVLEPRTALATVAPYICHRAATVRGRMEMAQAMFSPRWRPRYMAVPAELALRAASAATAG